MNVAQDSFPPRFNDQVRGAIPDKEIRRIEEERASNRIIAGKKIITFMNNEEGSQIIRSTDTWEFKKRVREVISRLLSGCQDYFSRKHHLPFEEEENGFKEDKTTRLGSHYLLKHLPIGSDSNLINEGDFWNLETDIESQKMIADALVEIHEMIRSLPPEAHELFPIKPEGRRLGHYVRTGLLTGYQALLWNEKNPTRQVDARIATHAGYGHDLGKEHPEVLPYIKFEGKLNPEVFEIVKKHPVFGALAWIYLQEKGFISYSRKDHVDLQGGSLLHHVNFTERSYPPFINPVSFADIPLITRMISVADAFDSMTSERPHHNRNKTAEEAIEELKRCACLPWNKSMTKGQHNEKQFDPVVVMNFIELNARPQTFKLAA